jgi:hypothetical protein
VWSNSFHVASGSGQLITALLTQKRYSVRTPVSCGIMLKINLLKIGSREIQRLFYWIILRT